MKRLMIDCETVSLAVNPALVSIGAVRFDECGPHTGPQDWFHQFIDWRNSGLDVSKSTLEWWATQPEEAQSCLYRTDAAPLKIVLSNLFQFVTALEPDEVWFNGPGEDGVWLRSAYAHAGFLLPWKYSQQRDFRTLRELYKNMGRSIPELGTGLMAHNALDDAIYQARVAGHILRNL